MRAWCWKPRCSMDYLLPVCLPCRAPVETERRPRLGAVAVLARLLGRLGFLLQPLGLPLGGHGLGFRLEALFLRLELLELGGLLRFGVRPFRFRGGFRRLLLLLRLGFLGPGLAVAAALIGLALLLLGLAACLGSGLVGRLLDPRPALLRLALAQLGFLAQAIGAFALPGRRRRRFQAPDSPRGELERRPRQLQRRTDDGLGNGE